MLYYHDANERRLKGKGNSFVHLKRQQTEEETVDLVFNHIFFYSIPQGIEITNL